MARKASIALLSRRLILCVTGAVLATALLAVLAVSSPANAAAYTFTQIDVPGASSTAAFGINNAVWPSKDGESAFWKIASRCHSVTGALVEAAL
jgi:hypothetical protein